MRQPSRNFKYNHIHQRIFTALTAVNLVAFFYFLVVFGHVHYHLLALFAVLLAFAVLWGRDGIRIYDDGFECRSSVVASLRRIKLNDVIRVRLGWHFIVVTLRHQSDPVTIQLGHFHPRSKQHILSYFASYIGNRRKAA